MQAAKANKPVADTGTTARVAMPRPPKVPAFFQQGTSTASIDAYEETDSIIADLQNEFEKAKQDKLDADRNVELCRDRVASASEVVEKIRAEKKRINDEYRDARNAMDNAILERDAIVEHVNAGLFSLLEDLCAETAFVCLTDSEYVSDTHRGLPTDATSMPSLREALSQIAGVNSERKRRGLSDLRIDLDLMAHAALLANARTNGVSINRGHRGAFVVAVDDGQSIASVLCRGEACTETAVALGRAEINGETVTIRYPKGAEIDPDRLVVSDPKLLQHSRISSYLAICLSTTARIGVGICKTAGASGTGSIVVELAPDGVSNTRALSQSDMEIVLNGFSNGVEPYAAVADRLARVCKKVDRERERIEKALGIAEENLSRAQALLATAQAGARRCDHHTADIITAMKDVEKRRR